MGAGTRRKNEAEARPRDGVGALDSFKRRWHGLGLYLGKNINADYEYGVVIAKECDLEAEWWPPDDRYI
jgi:hypothetical protein